MDSEWEAQQLDVLLGLGSWVACSIGMMVFNKLALQVFPLACTLVLLQFIITLVILLVTVGGKIHIGSKRDVLRWLVVMPLFTGKILSTMLALENTPITLVMTFRTMSPMISLFIESRLPNAPKVTPNIWLSFVGTLMGMMLYIYDLEWSDCSRAGLGWVMLNNFLTVGDRLLQRYLLTGEDAVDISLPGVAFLNNLLSIPPVLVAAMAIKETARLPEVLQSLDASGVFWILASCAVSAGISYTSVWVTTLISATSFLVVINSSKFVIIALEVFVLKEEGIQMNQLLGATVSISAGVAYGLARLQADNEASRKAKPPHLSIEAEPLKASLKARPPHLSMEAEPLKASPV